MLWLLTLQMDLLISILFLTLCIMEIQIASHITPNHNKASHRTEHVTEM